ncbi:PREDICTED: cytochrome b5 isoform X2 [Vollenhovia emeryi]|uniref:cytochrome b5 isoform X2 n=1 Tax=Vollenhovia emeryi TaxID=411798 RepID=UPI0005F3D8D0|nr:PREDICTED: cytochrome b5 isoform X2 [Vollenhovia emeryi]
MSLDGQQQQERPLLTEVSKTHSSMDLVSLAVRSVELGDVKPLRESYLQVERDNVTEKSDTIREQRYRPKEKSRDEVRTIHLAEVGGHDEPDDCWLVIYDYVYDLTEFLMEHPGGQEIILEHAGRDATLPFLSTGHSPGWAILDKYKIGELPPMERIYRTPNGVTLSGL